MVKTSKLVDPFADRSIYEDPSEFVDPETAKGFIISYLLLKIITLNYDTDYEMMTVIPELPDSYISDPHLKSFLKLLIEGLSEDRSFLPSIDSFQKHQFLQVEAAAATDDAYEREYLEIVESIVCKNDFRRERVRHEVLAKHGYQMPHQ